MTYKISAAWHKPLYLKDGASENLIYALHNLDSIPNEPGVYVFGRMYNSKIIPLYIGLGSKLRKRIEQQLSSVKLMMSIKNAEKGKRTLLYCTVNLKRGQKPEPILKTVESALISHALAEGYELFNQQGTKFKQHTIEFTGNRMSESLAPRLMRIKSR